MPEENRGPWSKKFENHCRMGHWDRQQHSLEVPVYSGTVDGTRIHHETMNIKLEEVISVSKIVYIWYM